jgi:protein O-GlcNAc transferase
LKLHWNVTKGLRRAAPDSLRALLNVGNALQRLQRVYEAVEVLRRAAKCAPDYGPAYFNLGLLLKDRGETEAGERALLDAPRVQPSMIEAMLALADLYELDGRVDEAQRQYERALAFAPDHVAVLFDFGMYWSRRRRFDKATECFYRVKARNAGFKDIESVILFSLNYRTDVDVQTIADEHRRVGAAITQAAGDPFRTWTNTPIADRPLRVGYVSGDFLTHPVAVLLRPVLENHSTKDFVTYWYSNNPHPDPVADFLRERTQNWRLISAMNDNYVIAQIRSDEIDILVNLSGHTARHRLPVFARHPAPVQVTWLGYLNTTGLPAMDYRLCDRHTDPPGSSECFSTEKLVRMPHSQWCYMPWHHPKSVAESRLGAPDTVIFGSFNQDRKISDECLNLWSRVLERAPHATLLVLDFPKPEMQALLLRRAERAGIDPTRISVRGRESISRYFGAIASVDIALHTFPYNGVTTMLDTLWLGVPIVALRGSRGISRGGYSILKSLGADDLIAETPDDYVTLKRSPRMRRDVAREASRDIAFTSRTIATDGRSRLHRGVGTTLSGNVERLVLGTIIRRKRSCPELMHRLQRRCTVPRAMESHWCAANLAYSGVRCPNLSFTPATSIVSPKASFSPSGATDRPLMDADVLPSTGINR